MMSRYSKVLGDYRPVDPIYPGVSIGISVDIDDQVTGTLGAFITDEKNNPYILTAGDLTRRQGFDSNKSPILTQPSLTDLDQYLNEQNIVKKLWNRGRDYNIGAFYKKAITNHKITTEGSNGQKSEILVGINISVFKYTSDRAWTPDPKIGSYMYNSNIVRMDDEVKTNRVVKRGRRTGITYGTLVSPRATIAQLSMAGDYLYSNFRSEIENDLEDRYYSRFHNQYLIVGDDGQRFGNAGDSGAICYLVHNNTIRPIALFHSTIGNTLMGVATPIDAVMDYLNGFQFAGLDSTGSFTSALLNQSETQELTMPPLSSLSPMIDKRPEAQKVTISPLSLPAVIDKRPETLDPDMDLKPAILGTSIYEAWKLRLELLQPMAPYLSSLDDLISAGLTYILGSEKTPVVVLYCHDPHNVQKQLERDPYSDSSQKFVVCRPGDITYMEPDLEPPSLEFVNPDLLSAFNLSHQALFEKHSNITAVTTGYWYSESTQMWSKDPCVLVYVYKKGYIPWGEDPISKMLDGKPIKVMEGMCYRCARAGGEYRYIDPIIPGVSVGVQRLGKEGTWGKAGTLGAFLIRDNNPYILTNCHVVDIGCIFHPKFTDLKEQKELGQKKEKNILAKMSKAPKDLLDMLKSALQETPDEIVNCDIGHVVDKTRKNVADNNKVFGLDLAVCRYESDREWKADPQIPKYKNRSTTYTYTPEICTLTEEFKSTEVVKKGRTTDTRYGTIQNPRYGTTSVAHHIFLGDYFLCPKDMNSKNTKSSDELLCTCENKTNMEPVRTVLYNQYVVRGKDREGFGDKGDSGSVCYLIEGDRIRPLGLYHSNITNFPYPGVLSPIGAVMKHLQGYNFANPN